MRIPLSHVVAACLAAFTTSGAFAQSEPVNPAGTAIKEAHDRLPADEPKGTALSSTSSPTTATAQPSEGDMMKMMMEMSKLNDNHKLLASLDGTWDYTVKMWMNGDPSSKPQESTGRATRKSIMGGRYSVMDAKSKLQMPGPDGKMKEMDFNGISTEGYDNAKQKFVSTWMDSMGTGIMMSEGTYDLSAKAFTYTGEFEMAPGVKEKVREVVKLTDKDHMLMEYYENRAGQDVKTMEIAYTRKK